jgi:hypothetical protein
MSPLKWSLAINVFLLAPHLPDANSLSIRTPTTRGPQHVNAFLHVGGNS